MDGSDSSKINTHYEQFWSKRTSIKVYPTEFVVRTFLATYPNLHFPKPMPGARVLDIGLGDGRNTVFLCDLGYDVSGTEITQGIVDKAKERMASLGHKAELKVGRNSSLPFDDQSFDCILACHSCYYCDEGESFSDNMAEYSRVLKDDGFLVASVANRSTFIFNGAEEIGDGSMRITNDPYGARVGYRLYAFSTTQEIAERLEPWFYNFSFGSATNDYYGIDERVFWCVCQKKRLS